MAVGNQNGPTLSSPASAILENGQAMLAGNAQSPGPGIRGSVARVAALLVLIGGAAVPAWLAASRPHQREFR